MEYVKCNNCGSNNPRPLFTKKDKLGVSPEEFTVVECTTCGLLYLNPRPSMEEIGQFYPGDYQWKETLESTSVVTRVLRQLEKGYRYHLLNSEVAKVIRFTGRTAGKVLDVGCGTGDRLDAFRNRGFETWGVETSQSALFAADHLNLNVLQGDLFSARFPDNFFDIISVYHVLEHTHDPRAVCHEIQRILKKDGFLVLQIPNTGSIQFRLFKKQWAAFDVPRDLYYFRVDTLGDFLHRSGFGVQKVDHFMTFWHPPTLVISLFPELDPQKAWRREGQGRGSLFQRLAWILLTLALSPLTHLESAFSRGAIVTCYATRR